MKNAILITNVDSLLGYALAYRFLEDWNRKEEDYSKLRDKTEFRLSCRQNVGLEDLVRLGGLVMQVDDYQDKDFVNNVLMKGVGYVIYIPENSENRVKEGEVVIQSAKEQGVEYLVMFSHIGVDHTNIGADTNRFHILRQFHHLEKQVSKYLHHNSYCIVRSSIWHQFFFYFGPMMEDQNKIKLTTSEKRKWNTIDLADLVDATYNLSTEDYDDVKKFEFRNLVDKYVSNLKKKNKILFEFSARHNITAEYLLEAARGGLGCKEMTYEKVDSNELQNYLYSIHHDNRFRHRPHQDTKDLSDHLTNTALGGDRPYTFPLGQFLNEQVIKMLIEFWELVEAGHADKITEHLAKALGRDPITIKDFFKDNKDQFKRLK